MAFCLVLFVVMILPLRAAATLDLSSTHQLIVCLAPTATSSEGQLQRYERSTGTGPWIAVGQPWPVMFGRAGLVWGYGLNPLPAQEETKKTNDRKTPMGVFRIGSAFGYASTLPSGAQGWPYHQVTDRDAWMDDPALPNYNHLYTLPTDAPQPVWWEKERMHLGDAAYAWMLLIEHNYSATPVLDGGNAIFFHIRRGEHYRTSGCTTMAQSNLEKLIKWLRPDSQATVVTLTWPEYQAHWQAWDLPSAAQLPNALIHQPPEPVH